MATTKPTQRSITEDYVRAFDGMRSYQKMRLGYVYGCLVVGFTCDGIREPRVYKPTFHLHNLAKPFPTVSLIKDFFLRCGVVPASDRLNQFLFVTPCVCDTRFPRAASFSTPVAGRTLPVAIPFASVWLGLRLDLDSCI